MKAKDILNLPKNESSLSIAKSYLQSATLNIKEQEKLFLFILGILNELDRYQDLLSDGKEYLSQIYEPNETYNQILKLLFDAALKLEQFDLAKHYLNERAKYTKILDNYLITDDNISLKKQAKEPYHELLLMALKEAIPKDYKKKYYLELLDYYLASENYLEAENILNNLKVFTNENYPREELKILMALKKHSKAEELANLYQEDLTIGLIPSVLALLEIYIERGESNDLRKATILETKNLENFEEAQLNDRRQFYSLCKKLYEKLDNHLSIEVYDEKIKSLNKLIKTEKAKEKNQQKIINDEFLNTLDVKTTYPTFIPNLSNQQAEILLNNLFEISMFSESINDKFQFREYLRTLFIYIDNYVKPIGYTIFIKDNDIYSYKKERLYDDKIIPEYIIDTPFEDIIYKGLEINTTSEQLKLSKDLYTQKPIPNNIKHILGYPISNLGGFLVYLADEINPDEYYLFFKNISALLFYRINREKKLKVFRKENLFLTNILASDLGPIRTLSNISSIYNSKAQKLLDLESKDYLEVFLRKLQPAFVHTYKESIQKLFSEPGLSLDLEYVYGLKNIKERMVSVQDEEKVKIVSIFTDKTDEVVKYQTAYNRAITDPETKLYNQHFLREKMPELLNSSKISFILIELNLDNRHLYSPDQVESYLKEFAKITDDFFVDGTTYRQDFNLFLITINQNDIRAVTNLLKDYLDFLDKYEVISILYESFKVKIGVLRYPVVTNQKNIDKIFRFLQIAKEKAKSRKENYYYQFTYKDYEEEVYEQQILDQINYCIENNDFKLRFNQIINLGAKTVWQYESELYIENLNIEKDALKLIAKKRNRLIDFEHYHITAVADYLAKLINETQKVVKITVPVSEETILDPFFTSFLFGVFKARKLQPQTIRIKVDFDSPKGLRYSNYINELLEAGISLETNLLEMVLGFPFNALHVNFREADLKWETYYASLKELLIKFNAVVVLRGIDNKERLEVAKRLGINFVEGNLYKQVQPDELIKQIKEMLSDVKEV